MITRSPLQFRLRTTMPGAHRSALKLSAWLLVLLMITAACNNGSQEDHAHASGEQYTCPMHPQVVQDKPGTCPICGMDLVSVSKTSGNNDDIMLSDTQMKLANITTKPVAKKAVGQTVVINGRLVVNEQRTEVISSRAAGRIENLFIKETGQRIRPGEPLYVLYSEELLTLQQEYLLAKEQYALLGQTQSRYKSFLDAAERKLLLYGLTQKQINNLSDKTSLQPRVTFLAPLGGIVTEINVSEGQYVNEGTALYKTEDISSLWVEAELYPAETGLVNVGDKVTVMVSGTDARSIEAEVTFLSPEFRNNSQITILRATINNPDNQFKAGQHARVFLTHSAHEAIAIPTDAVIRDEHGSHVYVRSANNTFRPRIVKTGVQTFDQVEITDGLNVGDTVAVTGAYLLYSEIILKKGSDPMQGHDH